LNSVGAVESGVREVGSFTGAPQVNYEFTVRANTNAVIKNRILTEIKTQYDKLPDFVALGSDGAVVVNNLYKFNSSTLDVNALFSYGFETSEVGYYVLPGSNSPFASVNTTTLSGVDFYVLVRTSGTIDAGSGLFDTSGFVGGSGLTAANLFGGSGADDVPFLVISRASGIVYLNESGVTAWAENSGITSPIDFKFTIFTRVRLNTDSVATTYEVDDSSLRHDVVIFKNPTS
jgi:hypothetical protein